MDDLLWVAQESLRTNLVHGTAGNFSARLPDGNVVLTPSSLEYDTMTLDDLVVCDLDGNVRRGHARPDHREDAAPRVPEGVRRHPRRHPLPRQVLHDVRDHAPADPVRDRRGRGVRRRRRAGRRTTSSPARRNSPTRCRSGSATAPRCSWPTTACSPSASHPKDALKIANLVEITAEMVWGAKVLGELVPLPDTTREKMAPIYKMLRGM